MGMVVSWDVCVCLARLSPLGISWLGAVSSTSAGPPFSRQQGKVLDKC